MSSNHNFSKLFLVSFLTLFSFYLTAQSSIVTGVVIDENKETMPGVNVKLLAKMEAQLLILMVNTLLLLILIVLN